MNGTDWETYESKGYAMDAYIGKDGLEQAFEEELHGSDGTRVTTITADGNILEEHYAVDPVAGQQHRNDHRPRPAEGRGGIAGREDPRPARERRWRLR